MSRHIAAIGAAIASARHSSPRRQRVGQEHTAWDDPETPPERLKVILAYAMGRGDVVTLGVLANPNMPPNVLRDNAKLFPQYVEKNPVLDLLELEDPRAFSEIRKNIMQGWLTVRLPRLPTEDYARLQLSFAGRVLPVFEAMYSGQARDLLTRAAAFLEGEGSGAEIQIDARSAADKSYPVVRQGRSNNPYSAAAWALFSAAQAASQATGWMALPGDRYPGSYGWKKDVYHSAQMALAPDVAAMNAEEAWQAEQVRRVYYANQEEAETLARLNATAKKIAENIKTATEAAKGKTATKAQIQKATQQAKESAQKIAAVMASNDAQSWPKWITLGAVVATGAVVLCIGPEALAAAGIAGAADVLIGIAEAADIATVSVSGLEGFELAELTLKFRAAGVAVTTAAVEVVTR